MPLFWAVYKFEGRGSFVSVDRIPQNRDEIAIAVIEEVLRGHRVMNYRDSPFKDIGQMREDALSELEAMDISLVEARRRCSGHI